MCLVRKLHLSERLHSSRSHSAIGREFNVDESAIGIE